MNDLLNDLVGTPLGDKRRTARLDRIVAAAAHKPDATFPTMMGSDAALEGLYRFANSEVVTHEKMVAQHRRKAVERAAGRKDLLVVHDTTSFRFAHADPEKVGYLQTGKPGFYAHFSLLLSGAFERRPLGVLNVETIVRAQRSRGLSRHRAGSETSTQPDRESMRWEKGVERSQEALGAGAKPIHVADREADFYSLLGFMVQRDYRFVVRVQHDRRAHAPDQDDGFSSTLKTLATKAKGSLERDVRLSPRRSSTAPRQCKAYPARKTRIAKLRFAATTVVIRRPRHLPEELPEELTLNIVYVREMRPPRGQQRVEWLIATAEPVTTPDQIAAVVDTYRARWLVEEYFKALKTGCIYQKRRLESLHALLNGLAIFIPIACHLLWLRACAREVGTPATKVLTKRQIRVLRTIAAPPLPEAPTARDALLAVAAIGGHLKRNGEPGWATVGKGLEHLLAVEVGWAKKRRREM